MTGPPRCAQCGHELGMGRYCTNCGLPVEGEWRTDTAERPSVPPTVVAGGVPPPAFEPPPQARYPLFADEAPADAGAPVGTAPPTVAVPTYVPPPPGPPTAPASPTPPTSPTSPTSHRRRRGALPWVVALAAVVLLALVGALLLLGGDDGDDTARDPAPSSSRQPSPSVPTSTAPPGSEPATPSQPSQPADPAPAGGPGQDLTGSASVRVPATAPPSTDVDGDPVTYMADNMLDGVRATAWRMPGDGTGRDIRIDLGGPVQLEQVGIVNGYAKRDPGYDGYTANRRITRVIWRFDDGSEQAQLLDEVRRMQVLDVGPVTTTTITLRIVTVTAPGRGRQGRDYTAISDLFLAGAAAG